MVEPLSILPNWDTIVQRRVGMHDSNSPALEDRTHSGDPAVRSLSNDADFVAMSLVGAVQELSLARDLRSIMDITQRTARRLMGADGVSFVLREGDRCHYAAEDAIGPLWKDRRFPMSACVSGWVMTSRTAAAIQDIEADPRVPLDAYRPTFVKSLCMVPIRTRAPIGAIGVYWSRKRSTTPHELAILQALADSTSIAMENVELLMALEKRVQDRTRELEARTRELAEKHEALLELTAQKRALSALVAHDLRSPAFTIMVAASRQLRSYAPTPAERCPWTAVYAAAERITRTASSLLDIAQSERGTLVPRLAVIDLGDALRDVREQLSPLAEKQGQTIELSYPAGVMFRADPELLGRVLQNLVDNALEHAPAKSSVRIEAREESGWIRIAVRDEGPGIPPEMRDRVFEPYVQMQSGASTHHAGRGLGLSFCRLAVEAHGGEIWIESNEPQGSRVCFRIPSGRPVQKPDRIDNPREVDDARPPHGQGLHPAPR